MGEGQVADEEGAKGRVSKELRKGDLEAPTPGLIRATRPRWVAMETPAG